MDVATLERSCACGWLATAADDPAQPVEWVERTGEYQLVLRAPAGRHARAIFRYCPRCGGLAVESRRDELFAKPTEGELRRLAELAGGYTTLDEVLRRFGPPEEDHPSGISVTQPGAAGHGSTTSLHRTLLYVAERRRPVHGAIGWDGGRDLPWQVHRCALGAAGLTGGRLDRAEPTVYAPPVLLRLRMLLVVAVVAVSLAGCVDKPTEHRVRANAYLRGGDAEKALAECDAGLAKSPQDVSLLILRGKALFELGRFAQAREAYQHALQAGDSLEARALGEAHLGLAMVAVRTEDFAEARRHFAKLVEADARDVDARINLARVCLQLEDIACALEHGVEAGHQRGTDEAVLFTLGRIYTVAKKFDEAEKTFQHICEVVPGASSCPYGVALVAAQRGDRERALDKLREAIDKKLPNPEKLADDPLLEPIKEDVEFRKLASAADGD